MEMEYEKNCASTNCTAGTIGWDSQPMLARLVHLIQIILHPAVVILVMLVILTEGFESGT